MYSHQLKNTECNNLTHMVFYDPNVGKFSDAKLSLLSALMQALVTSKPTQQ